MRSRAYRRHQRRRIIKKRAKKIYRIFSNMNFADFYNKLIKGEHYQWIKHTGRVCSCYICKDRRYSKKDRRVEIFPEDIWNDKRRESLSEAISEHRKQDLPTQYKIVVYLDNEYKTSEVFIYESYLSLVKSDGLGRKLLNNEITNRFGKWYFYDIM